MPVTSMARSLLHMLFRDRSAIADRRRALLTGAAGIGSVVVALLAAAVLYAAPIGEHQITAYLAASGGVRAGDQVRVAGIRVGTVRSVRLDGHRVELVLGLRRELPIGQHTTLDVKLLTPLGGHYITLTLADQDTPHIGPIPVERTTIPYELPAITQRLAGGLHKVDSDALRRSLAGLNDALTQQTNTVPNLVTDLQALTATIGDRNGQLERGIAVLNDYSATMIANRTVLIELVSHATDLTQVLTTRRDEVTQVIVGIAQLFAFVHRPAMLYAGSIEPTLQKVQALLLTADDARNDIERMLSATTALLQTWNTLAGAMGPATVAGGGR